MIILALDQSTRVSGWSIFDNNKLKDFGHWNETSDDIGNRFYNIINLILEKVKLYNPGIIYFENIQLQSNKNSLIGVDTFQKLAQLQGAIILFCKKNNIPYKIVYASEWRKHCNFLKGNDKHRKELKKITLNWVLETYGFKCTQDEADAICIGYYASLQEEEYYDWS